MDRILVDCIKALSQKQPIQVRNPMAIRPWQHVLEPLGGYLMIGASLKENPVKYSGGWNFGPADAAARSVEDLVKAAEEQEPGFAAWHAAAKLVTPYAQEFRYPVHGREPLEIDEEHYRQAEQAAAGIFAFVCSLLPVEAQPPLTH